MLAHTLMYTAAELITCSQTGSMVYTYWCGYTVTCPAYSTGKQPAPDHE